jgi:hypothetical protein
LLRAEGFDKGAVLCLPAVFRLFDLPQDPHLDRELWTGTLARDRI